MRNTQLPSGLGALMWSANVEHVGWKYIYF